MSILVSACLLGVNCRYDGKNGCNDQVMRLMETHSLIPVCPEQLGGLPTPREPSERTKNGVMNKSGCDVTACYQKGAKETLKLAELYGCRYAILKERSPSCGQGMIYDGSFSGRKIPGDGVTAQLLKQHGITVLGESCLAEPKVCLFEEEGEQKK